MEQIINVRGDYHVHTGLSADAQGTMEEYCERALELGLGEIGFSEHLDLWPTDAHFGVHDYERYAEAVAAARGKYGDKIGILMGVEVTYFPELHQEIAEFFADRAYDYVIGGVHGMEAGELGISDEYEALEAFARREVFEMYRIYFEHVEQMVRSGLFDVVAHLDLINRYGMHYLPGQRFHYGSHYGELCRIFEGMIKRQMALEINTSGLRQGPKCTYPGHDIVRLYREIGGEAVIVGSDAHCVGDLGSGIAEAVDLARGLGLCRFVSFRQRSPVG